jgi:hypothetical protein
MSCISPPTPNDVRKRRSVEIRAPSESERMATLTEWKKVYSS